LKYFLRAAHSPKGHIQAAVNVGRFYHQGIGVEVDEALGCHYFKIAADAGDSKSQAMMGTCFSEIKDFPHDDKLAYEYFKLAADAGVELAKTELGRLFNTDGTPKPKVNPNSQ
jgi:TPR repeat protein